MFDRRHAAVSSPLAPITLALAAFGDVVPNAAAAQWEILRQDLRYTARALRRSFGFALTAVLVVALGVGANTAAFSLADFVLLRPLPFPEPDRLVKLWARTPGYTHTEVSPANYRDWRATSKSFTALGAFVSMSANLVGQNDPLRVQGSLVTTDLLPLIGVRPMFGRSFAAADGLAGAGKTLLLSYGLWQTHFGADSGIVGRSVSMDGNPYVIVGVMGATFNFPNRQTQFWTPFQFRESDYEERDNAWLEVVGRLRSGVTIDQARADMTLVASQLEQQYPKENRRMGASVDALQGEISNQARLLLEALCGAALCILLLACANLANLLLARAVGREREMSVRAALGAGRERLVRQLVTESAVLAIIGGIVGVVVAVAAMPALSRLVPTTLPISQQPSVDLRVLTFAGLLTAITGIAFGMIPALRAGKGAGLGGLRDGSRAGAGRRQRARFALVTVEVGASVVLLVCSGLLVRAMLRLQQVDPGFRPEAVITMRTALPLPQYDSVARRATFYQRVLTEVRALPGVSSAAYISGLPMAMQGGIWAVTVPGRPVVVNDDENSASLRFATPHFFSALGIPLRKGRDLDDEDAADRPFVAVVSESFARRYWPNDEAIGKHFTFAFNDRTIVGVVGDIRVRGRERESEPQVYLSYRQVADGAIMGYTPKDLVIRSRVPAATLLPAVRRIITAVDPTQPISDVRTMTEIVAEETAPRQTQLRVLGALALIALLLAGVGIHGLLSFMVSDRSQEIGVRLALGARPRAIVHMVLREGAMLAFAGVIPGVALAYAAGRAMQSLLFGVRPADPLTVLVAIVLCFIMTMVGSLIPALRAVRVDPARVMRAE
jgi:putative ABC transport system permease protein